MPSICSCSCAMRSLSCAFWPARASRRVSKRWRSPLDQAGKLRFVERGRSGQAERRPARMPSRSASSRRLARGELVQALGRPWPDWPAPPSRRGGSRCRRPGRGRRRGRGCSPTTPPVGCWTFLTWLSTTTAPGATTAPDSSVIADQPPRPTDEDESGGQPEPRMAADRAAGTHGVFGLHDATPRSSTIFSE